MLTSGDDWDWPSGLPLQTKTVASSAALSPKLMSLNMPSELGKEKCQELGIG